MRRTGFVLAFCKRAKLVGLGTSLSPHSLIRYLLEHRGYVVIGKTLTSLPLFEKVPPITLESVFANLEVEKCDLARITFFKALIFLLIIEERVFAI